MAESRTKGFGERLRRAREEAGREIKALSEVTRVQSRYIEALESEDWSLVPKGVIGRGFVRVLSRELGVPAAEMLQLYQASRGDADSEPDRSLPEADWKVDLGAGRKRKPLLMAGAAALVVLGVAGLWFWSSHRVTPVRVEPEADQPSTSPAEAKKEEPTVKAPAAETPIQRQQASPPVAPVTGVMRLELEARDRVWVRVSEDGGAAREKVLKAGEKIAFQASKGFQVKLGNAGVVKLYWNGEALKPAGQTTQVVNLSLPKDLAALRP